MAEDRPNKAIKLAAQQIADIEMNKKDIATAKRELNTLKKLGMDVKMIEDKLTWAEEVSETLLKEFSV